MRSTTTASELAQAAMDMCEQDMLAGGTMSAYEMYLRAHEQFVAMANGDGAVIQEAARICFDRFMNGDELSGGVAAKLLDEVQSSNLVT